MSFEIIHFRDSDKIIKEKNMEKDVNLTMEYIDEVLCGTVHRGELLRQALEEMDWRDENVDLKILEGRQYRYKGLKNGIAIEGNLNVYEFILEASLRLQVGYDKGLIEAGILMLTSARSEKSHLGTSRDLAIAEIETLHPTISLPITLVLFDLGVPHIPNNTEDANE
ncbi:unnamed protein product [marine sediment metagenome]|uniref:Uncharacterized protein n=1 Tax=marine sediment metagenome TaxID=412755 RepID=X1PKN7_9ZZZZ